MSICRSDVWRQAAPILASTNQPDPEIRLTDSTYERCSGFGQVTLPVRLFGRRRLGASLASVSRQKYGQGNCCGERSEENSDLRPDRARAGWARGMQLRCREWPCDANVRPGRLVCPTWWRRDG